MNTGVTAEETRTTGEHDVTYFAYGSNLHPDKRRARADITYLDAAPARLDGYRLVFNLPGLQLIEPAMASVEPAPGDEVHGLLLRVSRADFERLAISEGAGRFYESVSRDVRRYDGSVVRAVLFEAKPDQTSRRALVPSLRYLDLIRRGARLSGLDTAYCDRLDRLPAVPIEGARRLAGELLVETVSSSGRLGLSNVAGGYLNWLQRVEQRFLPRPGGQAVVAACVAPCVTIGAGIRLGKWISRRIKPSGGPTQPPTKGGEAS